LNQKPVFSNKTWFLRSALRAIHRLQTAASPDWSCARIRSRSARLPRMQPPTAMETALSGVCQRAAAVAPWLTKAECVQLSMCLATSYASDFVAFLFNGSVQRAAAAAPALAMSVAEFEALFGIEVRAPCGSTFEEVAKEIDEASCQLQHALRCTLAETAQGAAWQRARTRLAAHFSMHTPLHDEFLRGSLGSLVCSDCRRLDDLRADLEDAGADVVTASRVIVALSQMATQRQR
jgi:hypothetical protein